MTINNKALVRQMMDEGRTFDEIVAATGLAENTIETYQYEVRRPDEIIKPNGRPVRHDHRVIKLRCHFTREQAEQILAHAVRYGCQRPALLIERLVDVILTDNLVGAVLDDEVDHAGP